MVQSGWLLLVAMAGMFLVVEESMVVEEVPTASATAVASATTAVAFARAYVAIAVAQKDRKTALAVILVGSSVSGGHYHPL